MSPSGDLIALPTMRDEEIDDKGNLVTVTWELTVIDVVSEEVMTLLSGEHPVRPLGFSPDGRRILYSLESGGSPGLWSVNTDGTDARLLVVGARWGAWQPVGG